MWIVVAGVFLLSAVVVRFARWMALKKSLLDIPNERSSHKQPIPRLGGAAFMPVVLLAVGLLAPQAGVPVAVFAAFLGGAIALYAVSLVDDFLPLSTTIRFAVQFAAAFGVLFAIWHSWPTGAAAPLSTVYRPLSSVLCPPASGVRLLASGNLDRRSPQPLQLHGRHRWHRRTAGSRRRHCVVRLWHDVVRSLRGVCRRLCRRWRLGFSYPQLAARKDLHG